MKKIIIPILGILSILVIFFLIYNKEENSKKIEKEDTRQAKKTEKYCISKLEDLAGDFNNAKSALWDDDNELKRIRKDTERLLEKCPTEFSNKISELRVKCNKALD